MFPGRKLFGSSASLLSSLATLGSAGAGACAGGVCTVAVQAGSAFAAGASGISGVLGASPAVLPFWDRYPVTHAATALPWWMHLLVAALILSTVWTVYQLHGHPWSALLAAMAGVASACAEVRWFPGGALVTDPVLAFTLPALVLAPWLPRIRWSRRLLRRVLILALSDCVLVLATVFVLQFWAGWQPCLLCWLQRLALLCILGCFAIALRGNPLPVLPVAAFSALLGGVFAVVQYLEVRHAQAISGIARACVHLGVVSCAQAGAHTVLHWPLVWWSVALFASLWTLCLVLIPGRCTAFALPCRTSDS